MQKYLVTTAKLSVLSAALLAAGCGGGGSAVTPDAPNSDPVAQRTVTGTASKGTIKKARVQAYSLDAQGNKSAAPISSTVTADDGSYSAKVPATVLTLVIEVDAAAGATMADEATGQDIAFPADMKLRNVVKLADGAESTVTSHVSPLTELVAKTAESTNGGLTAANIAQSKTGFAAALGFDPEKVKPVNSNTAAAATASPEERIQSLTLAAISKLAQDGKLGCTQALASDRVSCVVKEVAKSGSMSADKLTLGETLRGEMRNALVAVTGNPTINKTGMVTVDGLASFAQSVVPTVAGAPTGIASGKKLFAALRTNLNAWFDSDQGAGKLALQAEALKADFDNATAPLDKDLVHWMKLTADGIDYFSKFKAGTVTNATMKFYVGGKPLGGCTVYSDEAGNTPATSSASALNIGCSINRKMVRDSYVSGPAIGSYSYTQVGNGITLTPVSSQPITYSYKARAFTEVVTGSQTGTTVSAKNTIGNYGAPSSDRASGTISYTKTDQHLSSLTIEGMMPARYNDYGIAITDNELWNVTATRTAVAENVFNYALSGDFTSMKAGLIQAKLTVNQGSFARVQEDGNGNIVEDGVKELKASIVGAAGGSKIAGSVHMAAFMADKTGFNYAPTKVTFSGTLSSGEAQFFSGTLSAEGAGYALYNASMPASSTNFVKLTTSLAGTFTIPARPPLTISFSASNDSFGSNKESVQYNDGTLVLNASRVDDGIAPAVISVSSADGVSFKIVAHSEVAYVMKDNAKLAIINLKTGIINYVDGSFESLK